MAQRDGDIVEVIVAARGRAELEPLGISFRLGWDAPNRQIVLLPAHPGFPQGIPIWRMDDGFTAYLMCDLRLIALRNKVLAMRGQA